MKRVVRWLLKTAVILVLIGIPTTLVVVLVTRPPKKTPYVAPKRANVEVVTVRRDTLDDVVVPACSAKSSRDTASGYVSMSTRKRRPTAGCTF